MSTKNSKLKNDWWVPYAFLALPLIMYLIWVIIPVFQSFLYSFSKRDSIFIGFDFIGLKNYLRLFSDKTFWIAIKNNFFWLVLFVALPVPLGLFIAMLFFRFHFVLLSRSLFSGKRDCVTLQRTSNAGE